MAETKLWIMQKLICRQWDISSESPFGIIDPLCDQGPFSIYGWTRSKPMNDVLLMIKAHLPTKSAGLNMHFRNVNQTDVNDTIAGRYIFCLWYIFKYTYKHSCYIRTYTYTLVHTVLLCFYFYSKALSFAKGQGSYCSSFVICYRYQVSLRTTIIDNS